MTHGYIIEAIRTPMGKRGGALSDWHPADLLATTLSGLLDRASVCPSLIDDVICGCVTQIGEQSLNIARNAWLAAGLPESVPATTIDRQCGSSQQALHFAAQGIMAGSYEAVVVCGVESMSRVPMLENAKGPGHPYSPKLQNRYNEALVNQGISAEIVADRWGVGREEMDIFSADSHQRALDATRAGHFKREILPLDNGGATLDEDEGIREPNLGKMSELPSAFKENGKITAGNSSQITDGAAALLVTSESFAKRNGLAPRARVIGMALAATDPITMLTGPIPATNKVLERTGLSLDTIDAVEINEAFASVVLAWEKEMGLSKGWSSRHVNVRGGAIALGHPLGASGARLTTTLLHVLEDRGGRYGLQTMCEGGGLANATVLEMV